MAALACRCARHVRGPRQAGSPAWFRPVAIAAHLASDPALAPLVKARPGLRVPGAWDGFELAIRAVLGQQITVVAAARLAGKEAPKHADTEQTVDELRLRLRAVVSYLDGFTAKDFEGAATRVITQPRWEGKVMTGADYFIEHAQPNFFFHIAHAYAILRHNGVSVGKRDYLGALSQRLP